MKPKKKPEYNKNEIQKEYLEHAVKTFREHESIRAAARELEISPMKLRKILITTGDYENGISREIGTLYSSGLTVQEIAAQEGMTVSNVYAYLPYEKVIYKMDSKSVEAEKQQRYRERIAEPCIVDDELLAWLNAHPGIVADLRRRAGLDKT